MHKGEDVKVEQKRCMVVWRYRSCCGRFISTHEKEDVKVERKRYLFMRCSFSWCCSVIRCSTKLIVSGGEQNDGDLWCFLVSFISQMRLRYICSIWRCIEIVVYLIRLMYSRLIYYIRPWFCLQYKDANDGIMRLVLSRIRAWIRSYNLRALDGWKRFCSVKCNVV